MHDKPPGPSQNMLHNHVMIWIIKSSRSTISILEPGWRLARCHSFQHGDGIIYCAHAFRGFFTKAPQPGNWLALDGFDLLFCGCLHRSFPRALSIVALVLITTFSKSLRLWSYCDDNLSVDCMYAFVSHAFTSCLVSKLANKTGLPRQCVRPVPWWSLISEVSVYCQFYTRVLLRITQVDSPISLTTGTSKFGGSYYIMYARHSAFVILTRTLFISSCYNPSTTIPLPFPTPIGIFHFVKFVSNTFLQQFCIFFHHL